MQPVAKRGCTEHEESAWADADDFLSRLAQGWQANDGVQRPEWKKRRIDKSSNCDTKAASTLANRPAVPVWVENTASNYNPGTSRPIGRSHEALPPATTLEPKMEKPTLRGKQYDPSVIDLLAGKDNLWNAKARRATALDLDGEIADNDAHKHAHENDNVVLEIPATCSDMDVDE